jgi:uncharacterized protein
MKYILSKYNHFNIYNDSIVVGMNLFEQKIFAIEVRKYKQLILYKDNLEKLYELESAFFSAMLKLRIINTQEHDNNIYEIIIFENRKRVFNSDSYNLMILPTLNCNFNCWYCYEEDRPKRIMNQETVEATIKFIQNTIENKSYFILDWYGGEPLLCYKSVIEPISHTVKDICDKNGVYLESKITTNGYLLTNKMLSLFKKINIQTIQITLNGPSKIHNKIRYQAGTSDSYERIVNNIIMLLEDLKLKVFILRINFSKEYFDSISEIIDSFPFHLRKYIFVLIRQIEQDIETGRVSFEQIGKKLAEFQREGYSIESRVYQYINTGRVACDSDLSNHAIINYDGRIFKCHSVNFEKTVEDGFLTEDGFIEWKEEAVFPVLNKIPYDNTICKNCLYLPICIGLCSYRIKYFINNIKQKENCVLFEGLETIVNNMLSKYKHSIQI